MRIYSDGSCYPNPGPGGWAFVAYETIGQGDYVAGSRTLHEAYGGARETTNNRMEMRAVIEALRWADGRACEILSDSQLCVNTLTIWAEAWQQRGWRKRTEGKIANLDLVQIAFELYQGSAARITWVRGHTGDVGNERADVLAGQGRAETEAVHLTHGAKVAPSEGELRRYRSVSAAWLAGGDPAADALRTLAARGAVRLIGVGPSQRLEWLPCPST